MPDERGDHWSAVIEAVKTPLSFLVLGFLIADGTLFFLWGAAADQRPLLVWCAIIFVPAFVLTVVALAIFRPEALTGHRPLEVVYARNFGSDIFTSLDGYMRNLEKSERIEAWITAADVIKSDDTRNKTYHEFSNRVAARIMTLANLGPKSLANPEDI